MPTYSGHIRKRPTKKAENRWQVIIEMGYDSKGKRQRIFKTVEGTKKEAQAVLTEMLNDLNKGIYIEPSKLTVAQYLREWMETYVKPNLSPTTVSGYKINIENHIIPAIGNIPLQQLQPINIQRMYEQLAKKPLRNHTIGLSPKSIRYVHANLHEALAHAVKMQLVERNAADFVTKPKAKKYRASVYEEGQALALLEKAAGTDMDAPLSLAVGLGLRRGELLALKWSDIDSDKKLIKVQRNLIYANGNIEFKDPKTESGVRTLQIPDGLIGKLKKHQLKQKQYKLLFGSTYEDNDLVCCQENGKPYIPGTFSHKFSRFLEQNGLPSIRLHDLRHTNASLMLLYGVPAKVASQRLGHSNIGITLDLYSHVIGDLQQDAADKIDTGLFQKLTADSLTAN